MAPVETRREHRREENYAHLLQDILQHRGMRVTLRVRSKSKIDIVVSREGERYYTAFNVSPDAPDVPSPENSEDWLFFDEDGDPLALVPAVKLILANCPQTWERVDPEASAFDQAKALAGLPLWLELLTDLAARRGLVYTLRPSQQGIKIFKPRGGRVSTSDTFLEIISRWVPSLDWDLRVEYREAMLAHRGDEAMCAYYMAQASEEFTHLRLSDLVHFTFEEGTPDMFLCQRLYSRDADIRAEEATRLRDTALAHFRSLGF